MSKKEPSYLNITESRDGRYRATVQVKARIDIEEIVAAIYREVGYSSYGGEGLRGELKQVTKGSASEWVREAMLSVGWDGLNSSTDGASEEVLEMIRERVLELWPELAVGR